MSRPIRRRSRSCAANISFSFAGAGGGDLDEARRELEQRLQLAVTPIDPRSAARLTDRIAVAPSLLDMLAPLVGLLLRDRDEAKV